MIIQPKPLYTPEEDPHPFPISEWDIQREFRDCWRVNVSSQPKTACFLKEDEYWFWDRSVEAGQSYLVGNSITTQQYLKKYSSPLSGWQKLAYMWALENPDKILIVENRTHYWRIYLRGEYVEFALPRQDRGGERNYITRNGKTKLLVNED